MKKLLVLGAFIGIFAGAMHAIPADARPASATDINGSPLLEGDLISANFSAGDPDIFIIKFKTHFDQDYYPGDGGERNGYKRLFLNPVIFNMYGHLGGFSRVRQVSAVTRDSFTTAGLFRNCETNAQAVWATEVTGEDEGVLHHVQISGDLALYEDPFFFDKVFCINTREENFYAKSITPYYHIAEIPHYTRHTCQIRPACLDSVPRCLPAEPAEGWCPIPTPTPTPTAPVGCYYQQVQCFTTPCNPVLVCPNATPTPDVITVQGVSVQPGAPGSGSALITASVTGYLANPCYALYSSLSHSGFRYDISLSATSTLGPYDGACVQVTSPFTRSVTLGNGYDLVSGTYSVYINGTYRASYVHSQPQ